jgi:meckelin
MRRLPSVALLAVALVAIGAASQSFDWPSGSCGAASTGRVYSAVRHTCIENPCASVANSAFVAATESCSCADGFVLTPASAVSASAAGASCVRCAASSSMASTTLPLTCQPCAASVIAAPPTAVLRNLFAAGAAQTVALNGSTWVYGGGNVSANPALVAVVAATWSATASACECPFGFVLTDVLASGVQVGAFICARCADATNATLAGTTSAFTCAACSGGSQFEAAASACTCSASGTFLVRRQSRDGGDYCAASSLTSSLLSSGSTGATTATPVNVDNSGRNGPAVPSFVMQSLAVPAALACASRNATACQLLANLCALALYDGAAAPCVLHQRLRLAEGCAGIDNCERPSTVPWLSYLRSSGAVFDQTTVRMRVSLRPLAGYVHDLRFVLFEYDAFGALLARRRLVDDLSLCDVPGAFARDFFFVGRRNFVGCNVNLRYFLQAGATLAEPTRLYELFLEDSDGSLVPVPVVVDATPGSLVPESIESPFLRRAASTDQTPVPGAWRRRFFLVDNVAARATRDSVPAHLTYARRVSLTVQLRDSGAANIFVPVLTVQYASALTAPLLSSSDFASGVLRNLRTNLSAGAGAADAPSFEFHMQLVRSDDAVVSALRPTLIVLCVLVFCTAFARTYGWMRRQQDLNLNAAALTRFVVSLCNHFANVFALYVFLTCGAFYVFFKHQAAAEWLVPARLDYVWGPLYAALAGKIVFVLHGVFEQCNADYFLIDWERPRSHAQRRGATSAEGATGVAAGPGAATAGGQGDEPEEGVSMWRSAFIANELDELQTRRSFRVLVVVLIVAVFVEGIGYNRLALSVPNAEISGSVSASTGGGDARQPFVVMEPLLRVAVSGFFWIIVSLVLYVAEYQIYYVVVAPHPLQAFADLCSVSNISILVLLEPMWGFYIHGESLHAFADASIEEFQSNLAREASGQLPQRGLGGVQQCQTFEVFIGAYLRQFLYACYSHLYVEAGVALSGAVGPVDAGHHRRCFEFLLGGAGRPRVFTPQTLSIKRQINAALKQTVRNAEKSLLNKFGLHAAIDFPPSVMDMNGPMAGARTGTDLFFIDTPLNYGQAFLSGLDFDLFVLYGLLYVTMDANILSTFWSLLTVYLIDIGIEWYRGREGTANLGSKTLIDDRFFI